MSESTALPPPPPPPRVAHPRNWRERLPELAALIGTVLVSVASAGFVTSSWTRLADPAQAMLLASGAAALTILALWFEGLDRRGLRPVISMVLVAASSMTASAVTLGVAAAFPGVGRASILVGGLAAAAHAGWLLNARRGDAPLAVATWAAAVYAAGPSGSAWSDRWTDNVIDWLGTPIAGFFDPTITSSVHHLAGIAHLAIGIGFLASLRGLQGRALIAMRSLSIVTLAYAALELNVWDNPLGAVAALGVVIGIVLFGLWREDVSLVVTGSIGALAAGVRVLAAVFSGKVLATIAVLVGGLALLAWAVHAMRARDEDLAVPQA